MVVISFGIVKSESEYRIVKIYFRFEWNTSNCYYSRMNSSAVDFLFSLNIFWKLPLIFSILLVVLLGYFYWKHKDDEGLSKKIFRRGVYAVAGFKIVYALFLTFAQYFVWNNNGLTRTLLNLPLEEKSLVSFGFLSKLFSQDGGYYYYYVFARYWLVILVSFAMAYLFYLLLKSLKKYNERFFIGGEPELGFALAFLVGWPDFVLFLPGIFMLIIPVSIFRLAVFKEKLTTLGWPFIIASLFAIIFGYYLLDIFHLGVLSI